MREYLLKGGFLMVDDFHGSEDWEELHERDAEVFPDRPVEDLTTRTRFFMCCMTWTTGSRCRGSSISAGAGRMRRTDMCRSGAAIRDDKGRIMVAICFNMHLGDAWEWADDPEYPETFASMAFREGLNYVVYGMTH